MVQKLYKSLRYKAVSLVLVLTLVVTGILPLTQTYASANEKATSLKISNPVTVLHLGDKYDLNFDMEPFNNTEKTYWKSSDKAIADVDRQGRFTAKKLGVVRITAYTQSGLKSTCEILVVSKYGVTGSQRRVDRMLAAQKCRSIYIKNVKNDQTYTIEQGRYLGKTLYVEAPLAEVHNYGRFKKVTIVDVADGTFHEYANGNSFVVKDKELGFNIDKEAKVNKVNLINKDTKLNLNVAGILDILNISEAGATVNITGAGTVKSLIIGKKATGETNDSTGAGDIAKTNINVGNGVSVGSIDVSNSNTSIAGKGKVSSVTVNANNVSISTGNTKVTIAQGVTGTIVGGIAVEGGKTVTTKPSGIGLVGSDGGTNIGGDGGNNNGGQTPVDPTPTPEPEEPQPEGTYAIRYETNGGAYIKPSYVKHGEKLSSVPMAEKANNLFLGWFIDSELTQRFYSETHTDGDIVLYAKYGDLEKNQQKKVDSFALSDQSPYKTFTINAPGFNATQVKDAITITNVGAGGTPELYVIEMSSGSFIVGAKDGFREGAAITLELGNGLSFAEKDADGNDMSADIRNASFTIAKEEVNSLELNSEMLEVKSDQVSNLIPPQALVDDITTPDIDESKGSFTYTGAVATGGAIIAIYDKTAPTELGIEVDAENEITYVKVVIPDSDFDPSNGNQVIYQSPAASEIFAMPETLPLNMADITQTDETTLTIPNYILSGYWKDYDHIGLSAETKIATGSAIVLMGADNAQGEPDVVYGRVTTVTDNGFDTTVTFGIISAEDIIANTQDYYVKQDVDYNAIVDAATEAGIAEQIEQQAMNSGFAKEAMNYLAQNAIKTDSIQELLAKAGYGPNVDIELPGFPEGWDPNVILPPLLLNGWEVKAKISTETDHFGDGGLMCQLFVTGTVEVPLSMDPLPDKLKIDLTATFEQELKMVVNVDGGIEWKWAAFIPYPSDIYMNTNVDVFDYTAIKVHAMVNTVGGGIDLGELNGIKDLDISSEIKSLLAMDNKENQMNGTQKLFDMYASLLENETDYVTLVEQQILDIRFPILGFIKVGVTGDFVIKANVNVVLGSSLEYSSGNRYNFWFKIFSGESGNSVTQLTDEHMKFQFYVMGMLGLRVGVVMDIGVFMELPKDMKGGTFEAAATGIEVETGAYVELYGYFVYTIESLNHVTTSDMSGALFVDFGIYLDISYFARVADGIASYQPPLYNKKFPLLSAGDRINVYDFSYTEPNAEEQYIIKNYTSDYLPDSYWSMRGMDLMEGNLVDVIYPKDSFVYTLSNPAFEFDPVTGKMSVTVPDNTRYMTCDMTITWRGAKLAFSNGELTRTIPIVWTNLADEELSLRHNISVVADGKVIWSKVVGEGEQYTLPSQDELKQLLDFGKFMYNGQDLKYSGGTLNYINQDGGNTILVADRDLIYTVDVTPRTYSVIVSAVQNEDGTTRDLTLDAKFGEGFDLTQLYSSGTRTAGSGYDTAMYTAYSTTWAVNHNPQILEAGKPAPTGGKPIDSVIDIAFAKQLMDMSYSYIAQYVDNSVTATYRFVDSRGKQLGTEQKEKLEKNTYPQYDYHTYALTVATGSAFIVKRFDKSFDKLTDNQLYIGTCVMAMGESNQITFTGDDIAIYPDSRYVGEALNLPHPQRIGYTFGGWIDENGVLFSKGNMGNESIALTAAWTANNYTVSFDVNATGSSVSNTPKDVTVTFGQNYVALPEKEALRRSNYKLLGWSTQQLKAYASDEIVPAEVFVTDAKTAGDHTLYAVWQLKKRIADDYLVKTKNEPVTYDKKAHPFDVIWNKPTAPTLPDGDVAGETPSEESGNVPETSTPPVALDSFLVQYKGKDYPPNRWTSQTKENADGEIVSRGPIDSDHWDVMLYRPEDEDYQLFKQVIIDGVTIDKAQRSDVTFTLPTNVVKTTYDTITIDAATAKGSDVEDGVLIYRADMWGRVPIINDNIQLFVKGTESKSLTITPPTQYEYLPYATDVEYRINVGLSGGRNYYDYWNTEDEYFKIAYSVLEKTAKDKVAPISVNLEIRTGNNISAGTNSAVYFELLGHEGDVKYSTQLDNSGRDDFLPQQVDRYNRTITTSPWMFNGNLRFRVGGKDGWQYKYMKYTIKNDIFGTIDGEINDNKNPDGAWIDNGYRDFQYAKEIGSFKRVVTDFGGFASWGGEYALDENSTGALSYTYDGKITDQYGTYNIFNCDAPARITVGAMNKDDILVDSPYQHLIKYSNYGVTIDKAAIYQRMLEREEKAITITIQMNLNDTFAGDSVLSKTITFTR